MNPKDKKVMIYAIGMTELNVRVIAKIAIISAYLSSIGN